MPVLLGVVFLSEWSCLCRGTHSPKAPVRQSPEHTQEEPQLQAGVLEGLDASLRQADVESVWQPVPVVRCDPGVVK